MKEFMITITEMLVKAVPVMAENENEALIKVRQEYSDGEIVLDYGDYNGENQVYLPSDYLKNNYSKGEVIEKLDKVYQELMHLRASISDINKTEQFDCVTHSKLNRIDDIAREVKAIEKITWQ